MVLIEDYNLKWADCFLQLKAIYEYNIRNIEFAVEHVGSTSIEGLCAKPIIDIAIIFYKQSDFNKIRQSLESCGYHHRGDLGITNREAFKYVGDKDLPKHNLYVCLDGILALKNQLLFRDYLRKHKDIAKEYCKLKKELAKKYDRDEYCYHKTEFITSVLKKCGLGEDELNLIKKMNEI